MANIQIASVGSNVLRDNAYQLNNATSAYERCTLLEKAGANGFMSYSTDLSNVAWPKSGMNAPSMSATGPNGVINSACSITEDTSTGQHNAARNVAAFTANTPQSFTLWVKANGRTTLRYALFSGADGSGVSIDLAAGTLANYSTGAGAAPLRSKITPASNGWYRVHFTTIVTAAATSGTLGINFSNPAGTYNYTGDGVSGVFVYNSQPEIDQPIWSSDMPSVGVVAGVRAADVAYRDLAGTSLSIPRESTWYVKLLALGTSLIPSARVFQIGDATTASTNTLAIYANSSKKFAAKWYAASTATTEIAAVASPALNDQVELLIYLDPTGKLHLTQALNGTAAATVDGSDTEAFQAAFASTKVYLNSADATPTNAGMTGVQAFKAIPGNYTLAQMQAL